MIDGAETGRLEVIFLSLIKLAESTSLVSGSY